MTASELVLKIFTYILFISGTLCPSWSFDDLSLLHCINDLLARAVHLADNVGTAGMLCLKSSDISFIYHYFISYFFSLLKIKFH